MIRVDSCVKVQLKTAGKRPMNEQVIETSGL